MEPFQREQLEGALEMLGALLEFRGVGYRVAVIGGGALLLLDLVTRPTRDLDLVALVEDTQLVRASPLPRALAEGAGAVARDVGLPEGWINGGPTALLDAGLPEGFLERAARRQFGALELLVASRYDQVHLKLYAAVDQGPASKHAQDLVRLAPDRHELDAAAAWCRRQDPSAAFAGQLQQALRHFLQGPGDAAR